MHATPLDEQRQISLNLLRIFGSAMGWDQFLIQKVISLYRLQASASQTLQGFAAFLFSLFSVHSH